MLSRSYVFFILTLIGTCSTLKCYHLVKELDFKTIRDKNLVECSPEHTHCVYMSVTAFLPRDRAPYPVHFETTRCSNGKSYEEKNKERYINLTMNDICDGSLKVPHKWDFTLVSKDGSAFRLMERINEVKCCKTDGCNVDYYNLIGGGVAATPWYRASYNWFKGLF